ncbi:MAG: hypothetical protein ACK5NC_15560 [Vibrio sp.]
MQMRREYLYIFEACLSVKPTIKKILNVAGLVLISLGVQSTANAANYSVFESQGRYVMAVNGHFGVGESVRFQRYLNQHREINYVLLQSHGGYIDEAIKIGKQIHQAKLDTAVETYCYSACFITLMSGQSRFIYNDAYVAVHRPFFEINRKTVFDQVNSITYNKLANYFALVLGDSAKSQQVVKMMYAVPPRQTYQVRPDDQFLSFSYYSQSGLED